MLRVLVTGIGLLQFLERAGLGDYLGFPDLVAGHIVICMPFAVRTSAISLAGLRPSLENAALGLGARPHKVLWTVTLPLVKGGVFARLTFAFMQLLVLPHFACCFCVMQHEGVGRAGSWNLAWPYIVRLSIFSLF